MTRRQFVESHGATCRNWQWSWSFVNEKERFVIFGAWERSTVGNRTKILSEEWQFDYRGHKNSGYSQSLEHVRLVQEEGFRLRTFPMRQSDQLKDEAGLGPSKIDGFDAVLHDRHLLKIGKAWYASDASPVTRMAEEVSATTYPVGTWEKVTVNRVERNAAARKACIEHHGCSCAACGFNFGDNYGEVGEGFIHVHHLTPIASLTKDYQVDPVKDLLPVCPNCHAMLHMTDPPLLIEQLLELASRAD